MNSTGYIKLWNDNWHENGKIYRVLSYNRNANSTSVQLQVQDLNGDVEHKVVPIHDIEWISDGDW